MESAVKVMFCLFSLVVNFKLAKKNYPNFSPCVPEGLCMGVTIRNNNRSFGTIIDANAFLPGCIEKTPGLKPTADLVCGGFVFGLRSFGLPVQLWP